MHIEFDTSFPYQFDAEQLTAEAPAPPPADRRDAEPFATTPSRRFQDPIEAWELD